MTLAYVPVAKFPNWDGSSRNRHALYIIREPDDDEIKQIISEIVAIQNHVSSFIYTKVHDNTVDWGDESGGYYFITVPVSEHGIAAPVHVHAWEEAGGSYIAPVSFVDQITIEENGDVELRVTADPDDRYAGRLVII